LTAALAIALIGVVAGGCTDDRTRSVHAPGRPAYGEHLKDPPQYVSDHGLLRVRVVVERRQVELAGHRLWALTYNGFSMPPTLRLRPGDRMDFTVVNRVRPALDLRFDGLKVSPAGRAGHAVLRVHPGATLHDASRFPRGVSPGTYWYHAYGEPAVTSQAMAVRARSGEALSGRPPAGRPPAGKGPAGKGPAAPALSGGMPGMSGIIVVEGLRRRLPPSLRAITEHVIALEDLPAGRRGGAAPERDDPAARTVNGQVGPVIPIRPGETQLWRLANIGTAVGYRLHLEGQRFQVLAQDASPVGRIWFADSLLVPPGARYDVLVQGGSPGRARLESLSSGTGPGPARWPRVPLATAVSAGTPVPCAALPAGFASMEDLGRARIAGHSTIVLSAKGEQERLEVDGRAQGTDDRVDIPARPGTVQEWTIRNASARERSFHMHTNRFQLMSVDGRPYAAHSWQDTVDLPGHGQVVIRLRFTGRPGEAVLHCRLHGQEDMGAMAVMEM
jgi:FtsP/CotA-like multicopper oxidase with cupredoxin domain